MTLTSPPNRSNDLNTKCIFRAPTRGVLHRQPELNQIVTYYFCPKGNRWCHSNNYPETLSSFEGSQAWEPTNSRPPFALKPCQISPDPGAASPPLARLLACKKFIGIFSCAKTKHPGCCFNCLECYPPLVTVHFNSHRRPHYCSQQYNSRRIIIYL